jgi:hypothetical protein
MSAELWHSCRRCRAKLSEPVSNQRSAFCCRGCHRNFYRKRCMACEGPKTDSHGKECTRKLASIKRHGLMGKFHQKRRSPAAVTDKDNNDRIAKAAQQAAIVVLRMIPLFTLAPQRCRLARWQQPSARPKLARPNQASSAFRRSKEIAPCKNRE